MHSQRISVYSALTVCLLAILTAGLLYNFFFLVPYQKEMREISEKTASAEAQIQAANQKIAGLKSMQSELDALFSDPESKISEIAPYDNAKNVVTELGSILSQSIEYSLTFRTPVVSDDGIVRRQIDMVFLCSDYQTARGIIGDLENCRWRCLINSISMKSDDSEGDVMAGAVKVSLTVTFIEQSDPE